MKDNELMADQIRKYMSYIYLVLFAGITIRYYLFTTVLEFNYPNVLYLGLRYVLMAYVLISIVLMVWQKQYSTVLEPVFMVLILVSAGIVTYVVKDNAVFDFALLLVGAKNVPWKRIAYVYLCVAVIIQGIAYYASTTGIVADIVIQSDTRIRHSLGINYPTDMAAHMLFIMLVYAAMREKKLTFFEITLMGVVSFWVYGKTFARNDFICAIVMCVLLYIVKIFRLCKVRLSKLKDIRVGAVLMLLFVAGCILAVTFYNPDSAVYQNLDTVFSRRISLGYQGLAQYGITAFGSFVEENQATLGYYFFLDNSFIRIAIKYGWVFLSLITYIYYLCFNKAVDCKKDAMIVALLIMLLFGISEHHLIDIAFCPIWFMLFSSMKMQRKTERGQN
mgnify:CR=1 FL=1